jgi:hypothetical protein
MTSEIEVCLTTKVLSEKDVVGSLCEYFKRQGASIHYIVEEKELKIQAAFMCSYGEFAGFGKASVVIDLIALAKFIITQG